MKIKQFEFVYSFAFLALGVWTLAASAEAGNSHLGVFCAFGLAGIAMFIMAGLCLHESLSTSNEEVSGAGPIASGQSSETRSVEEKGAL